MVSAIKFIVESKKSPADGGAFWLSTSRDVITARAVAPSQSYLYTEWMTLSALQSPSRKYTLLEFDSVFGLASAAGIEPTLPPSIEFNQFLRDAAAELFAHVSGVVLDAGYTYNALDQKTHGGVLFSLEQKMEAVDPLSLPRLTEGWGVEYVRNNYGVAKLALYYHPTEELAFKKQQFVAEIADFCRYQGIDFVLQLFVFHPLSEPPEPTVLRETQLRSVHDFARSCDLLAIEYLGDPLSAATITADLDIPWILTSHSLNYEATKTDLRAALESGAQGFMLGEVFWPVLPKDQAGVAQAKAAVQTTSRDRLMELARITNEFVG